jgi:protein SCO1/2
MKTFVKLALLFLFALLSWASYASYKLFFKEEGNRDLSLTFFASPQDKKLPFFRGKDLEAYWPDNASLETCSRRVDPFLFKNQLGQNVDQRHFQNKISVVSFFFAKCHGICPNIVRNLKFVQSAYLKDQMVQIVSYSVTPDLDTPEELKKFAEQKGIYQTKWNLLTGDREEIFKIARNTFQADTNTTNKNPTRDFVHSEQIFLIGPDLNFRGVYNGNRGESVKTLINDIKILEKEVQDQAGS